MLIQRDASDDFRLSVSYGDHFFELDRVGRPGCPEDALNGQHLVGPEDIIDGLGPWVDVWVAGVLDADSMCHVILQLLLAEALWNRRLVRHDVRDGPPRAQ